MKGRFLCALLLAALLTAPALAAGGLTSALDAAASVGEEFSADGVTLTLPAGMEVLAGDELAAYEAAVQFDYPDAAKTILAAFDPERGAALVLACAETEAAPLDAAKEAAEALGGDPAEVEEKTFGKHKCATFACEIDDASYRLYFLTDGARLLTVAQSGIEDEEVQELLATLEFKRGS